MCIRDREETAADRDLGELECDGAGVTDDPRAGLYQPGLQAGERPFGHFLGAVLHRSAAARNTPYPRWISGGAFEMRATEFGHPVQHTDANLGFRFLVFEGASF